MDDQYNPETNANSEAAPTPPTGALEISATGSGDASKLNSCYFTVSGLNWSLYNNGGNLLQSGTSSQTSFTFDHDSLNPGQPNSAKINWSFTDVTYTIVNNVITGIDGSWSNDDDSEPVAGPQSGSFEASGGGGIDPVTASASA